MRGGTVADPSPVERPSGPRNRLGYAGEVIAWVIVLAILIGLGWVWARTVLA